MEAATHYNAIDQTAINSVCGGPHCVNTYPFSTASNTGGTSGDFDEKTWGFFEQLDGVVNFDRDLKYGFGLRWVETRQTVWSPGAGHGSAEHFAKHAERRRLSGPVRFRPAIDFVPRLAAVDEPCLRRCRQFPGARVCIAHHHARVPGPDDRCGADTSAI